MSNDIYGTIVPNGSSKTQAMTAGKRLLLEFAEVAGHRYRAVAWLTSGSFGCGPWLENNQLRPRMELMEKLLKLWPEE